MPSPCTGAILAGGKSRRLGTDKCFLHDLSGQTLVQSMVVKFRRLFSETLIIANEPDRFEELGVPVKPDAVPGAGALGGIYTALLAAKHDRCFVAACDMPFLNEALVSHMIERPATYDVLVPWTGEEFEPLHAIYRKSCLTPIERVMHDGRRRIIDFFDRVKVELVREEELAIYDPDGMSFLNINTPDDLQRAQSIWEGQKMAKATQQGS